MPLSAKNIYMLGVGGMGMTPLALYLSESGKNIIGADDNLQEPLRSILEKNNITIEDNNQIPLEIDLLIYSNALNEKHPIIQEAIKRKLPYIRRGEMLAKITANKKLIAIVGSHGKTTTAGMLSHLLKQANFQFSYLIGGLFDDKSILPAGFNKNEWILAEVDESDGSIEHFQPEITLVLNVDWDHSNHYSSKEALIQTFQRLFSRTKSTIVIHENDKKELNLNEISSKRIHTYGENGDFRVDSISESNLELDVKLSGRFKNNRIQIKGMGSFNGENASAALTIYEILGCSEKKPDLLDFKGIIRRQEKLFENETTLVYKDYAHHPSEILALINTFKKNNPTYEIITVFQPHRFSRTLQFKKEFHDILETADEVILLPVYSASEEPIEGGSTEDIIQYFDSERKPTFTESDKVLIEHLTPIAKKETHKVILFIGAGDIENTANAFTATIKADGNVELAWQYFIQNQVSKKCKLHNNEPLGNKTTIKIGGASRFYAEPANITDLKALLSSAKSLEIPWFILGRGSNIIIPNAEFKGLTIRLNHSYWQEINILDENRIWAGAGARLKEVCGQAAKQGLSGLEFLEGIPATIGGALRMNAGAMGGWLFNVVSEVRFITKDGHIFQLPKSAFSIKYRECAELKDAIAIGVILKAQSKQESKDIQHKITELSKERKLSQPREPSAGCIFKNPEGNHAGKLIDELGLKGKSVGQAAVSNIHGNFIINNGNATSDDVIELVKAIRKEVLEKRSITLEPEVLLLGKTWDELL